MGYYKYHAISIIIICQGFPAKSLIEWCRMTLYHSAWSPIKFDVDFFNALIFYLLTTYLHDF